MSSSQQPLLLITYEDLCSAHKSLIDQLNNLQSGPDGTLSSAAISNLQTDFRQHCMDEEAAMFAVDYPYLHAHILAHSIAAKYFLRLSLVGGRYLVSDLIADILEHTNTYDAQFVEFCAQRSSINPTS